MPINHKMGWFFAALTFKVGYSLMIIPIFLCFSTFNSSNWTDWFTILWDIFCIERWNCWLWELKFVLSKKAKKFDKFFTDDLTLTMYCQFAGEDFINYCGLLRKYELYWLLISVFESSGDFFLGYFQLNVWKYSIWNISRQCVHE